MTITSSANVSGTYPTKTLAAQNCRAYCRPYHTKDILLVNLDKPVLSSNQKFTKTSANDFLALEAGLRCTQLLICV